MSEAPHTPLVQMQAATVCFGSVAAVDGVDFDLHAGEIHALLGENGAGKSTLTKAMAGVVKLSEGQMLLKGQAVSPSNPREALALGVAMVFQETSLVPTMTVAQRIPRVRVRNRRRLGERG